MDHHHFRLKNNVTISNYSTNDTSSQILDLLLFHTSSLLHTEEEEEEEEEEEDSA